MLFCLTVKLFYPFDGITLYYFSQVGGKTTFRELTEVARKPQAIRCGATGNPWERKYGLSSDG